MLKLVVCAILCAATPFGLRAQNGRGAPAAGAPGTAMGQRGGFGMFGRGPQTPPGPPAPVPPEVAIPRPGADEIVRMNGDLKQFIAGRARSVRSQLAGESQGILLKHPKLW